jgi:Na+/phosphate symporter
MINNKYMSILSIVIFISGLLILLYNINNQSVFYENNINADNDSLANLEDSISTLNHNILELNTLLKKKEVNNTSSISLKNILSPRENIERTAQTDKKPENIHPEIINPTNTDQDITAEQYQKYNTFNDKLADPYFLNTLNFESLTNSEEMTTLPEALRKKIMNKVITMLNNGEISEEAFIKGYKN